MHTHVEQARATGVFTAVLTRYRPEHKVQYLDLFARAERLRNLPKLSSSSESELISIEQFMGTLTENVNLGNFPNVVTTGGKNFLLDSGLGGSAYTATFFLGLISSVSYGVGPVVGDTAATHAGWKEAGGTNAPAYSGTRKTATWAAAAAGSKALNASLAFTFTSGGTVKGSFLATVNTIDSTSGVLYSAGLFTGGDQPVAGTNTLNVSYTASLN